MRVASVDKVQEDKRKKSHKTDTILDYFILMSRYHGPRLRIIRRLGELPALTRKKPKNQNPPGQHGSLQGKFSKKKSSQYGIRLREKQKLRFNYSITESQLRKYAAQAKKEKGSTGDRLLQLLEMRLDNLIFRLGMAPTVIAARQLVVHGHIVINGQKTTVPNYQCSSKDVISVNTKSTSQQLVNTYLKKSDQNIIPPHLTFQREKMTGLVNREIDRRWAGLPVDDLLVVEFYSNRV